MKKKTIALLLTVTMAAALCGCGSQPETTIAEENQTEDSKSFDDEEDAEKEISTIDEESTDNAEEENTDSESEDLSEDSTALDSDDAEESDEDEGDEGSSAPFDLGFMSFELPSDWEIDEYESSPEDDEYYLAPYGDVYITGMDISIMHENIEDEPEMVSMMFESEDAALEEYLNSELGNENYSLSISIKELRQTFIGKTREISVEMSDSEDEYSASTVIYLGLDNEDVYGIALQILNDGTEDGVDIQDGMTAIDMLFKTGKLLK